MKFGFICHVVTITWPTCISFLQLQSRMTFYSSGDWLKNNCVQNCRSRVKTNVFQIVSATEQTNRLFNFGEWYLYRKKRNMYIIQFSSLNLIILNHHNQFTLDAMPCLFPWLCYNIKPITAMLIEQSPSRWSNGENQRWASFGFLNLLVIHKLGHIQNCVSKT